MAQKLNLAEVVPPAGRGSHSGRTRGIDFADERIEEQSSDSREIRELPQLL